MTERILDMSESAAYLRVEHRQLVIEPPDQPMNTMPLSETAALVLAHPQVTCSLAVLAGVMENGGAVVVCDGAVVAREAATGDVAWQSHVDPDPDETYHGRRTG